MNPVLTVLTLWLGTTAAIVGGILWSTRMETLAELPDTPTIGHAGIAGLVADDCWIRAGRIKHGWHKPMGQWAAFDDLNAVRILSPGVTP